MFIPAFSSPFPLCLFPPWFPPILSSSLPHPFFLCSFFLSFFLYKQKVLGRGRSQHQVSSNALYLFVCLLFVVCLFVEKGVLVDPELTFQLQASDMPVSPSPVPGLLTCSATLGFSVGAEDSCHHACVVSTLCTELSPQLSI